MDNATALKIAQNYGVPPTPANISRIMAEAGNNEAAMLGRSMGMSPGGEYDDSILKSKLDKLDESTNKNSIKTEPLPSIQTGEDKNSPVRTVPSQGKKPDATNPGDYIKPDSTNPGDQIQSATGLSPWITAALLGIPVAGRALVDRAMNAVIPPNRAAMAPSGQAAPPPASVEPSTGAAMPPDVAVPDAAPDASIRTRPQAQTIPRQAGPRAVPNEPVQPPESGGPSSTPVGDNIPLNAPESTGYVTPTTDRPVNPNAPVGRPGPYDGTPTNLIDQVVKYGRRFRR